MDTLLAFFNAVASQVYRDLTEDNGGGPTLTAIAFYLLLLGVAIKARDAFSGERGENEFRELERMAKEECDHRLVKGSCLYPCFIGIATDKLSSSLVSDGAGEIADVCSLLRRKKELEYRKEHNAPFLHPEYREMRTETLKKTIGQADFEAFIKDKEKGSPNLSNNRFSRRASAQDAGSSEEHQAQFALRRR